MGDVVAFPKPVAGLRFRVERPIPVTLAGSLSQHVIAPGRMGTLLSQYDGKGPGVPIRNRAIVSFDGVVGQFDVSRDSIFVIEGSGA